MDKYFDVLIEFDHSVFYEIIEQKIEIKGKGYVCVIDANIMAMAQKNSNYTTVLNSAMVNTCDGSSIAIMAGWLHKSKFKALNGPEIFEHYIEKPYRQVLLGSTEAVMDKIKQKLLTRGKITGNLYTLPVPFCAVNDFDYRGIAGKINSFNPDIIWVCLGAPKQEFFMDKLLPYLNKGVMFGIGAAFNFYTGDLSIPAFKLGKLRFIWLSRLIQEPRKLSKRILQIFITFPKMYINELLKRTDQRK